MGTTNWQQTMAVSFDKVSLRNNHFTNIAPSKSSSTPGALRVATVELQSMGGIVRELNKSSVARMSVAHISGFAWETLEPHFLFGVPGVKGDASIFFVLMKNLVGHLVFAVFFIFSYKRSNRVGIR
mmetsp:Transcript_22160/g.36683  ORF Transcript_22160/g.36683 Transcript_22160/m.36683 type:complete len:126 (-) Transcript_22160:415-792(-)